MVIFPNCKINLGLHVVAKRMDGFHDLETVFFPVPVYDVLDIVPAEGSALSFQSSGLPIPGDPYENLCVKAYQLLKQHLNLPLVNMHLHKVIPLGAGLGGGSSDGTHTLKLLNQLFSLDLSDDQLMVFARQLGSDCAFFVKNQPVFAFGRGDQFLPVEISISDYHLVLVIPPCHVSTAQAYAGIKPGQPRNAIRDVIFQPVEDWKTLLCNDFEPHIFQLFPEIGRVKEKLYEHGALYASMSGSGSAVYGLFGKAVDLSSEFPGCMVWHMPLG